MPTLFFRLFVLGVTLVAGGARAADLNALKKLKILVAVPSSLPEGFKLTSAETHTTEADGKQFPEYQITYCNEKQKCFSIESAYGQSAHTPDGDPIHGTCRLFGNYTVNLLKAEKDGNTDKEDYVVTNWMPDDEQKKAMRNRKPASIGRFHHLVGTGLTQEQAKKIIESLKPLR